MNSKIFTNEDVNPNSQVATISFDAIPDAGSFTLVVGNQETAAIPFDAVALDVQDALRAEGGPLSEALVTGTFGLGFELTLVDCSSLISIGSNSLELVAVPIVITILVARIYMLNITGYVNMALHAFYGTNAGALEMSLAASSDNDPAHAAPITDPVTLIVLDAGGGSHLYNVSNAYFQYLQVIVPDLNEFRLRIQGARFGVK